jgi:HAE1 family hydrophobic/amphiphilic exporter-1
VLFVQEEAGQLFQDIALAISGAVGLSLLVSITLIPTASARLLRGQHTAPADGPGGDWWAAGSEPAAVGRHAAHPAAVPSGMDRPAAAGTPPGPARAWQRLRSVVSGAAVVDGLQAAGRRAVALVVAVNAAIQRGVLRRLAVVALLVGSALWLSWKFWPRVEYLPAGNRNLVFGILLPPPGYNMDQLMEMGETVEDSLRAYWDVDPESRQAQALDFPVINDLFFVAFGRQVFMGLRAYEPERVGELVPLIQQTGARIPGTFAVAKQASLFEQGLSAGRTIDIEITGPDLTRLVAWGGQIMGQVRQILPTAQARPIPSLDLSTPELHITPRLLQAAEMGVTSADLGFAANALIDGAYAGDYYLDGKKIDLQVIGKEAYASNTQDVAALPLATASGLLVPVGALADVTLSSGPEQVNHRERVRAITIEVSPPVDVPLEGALAQIDQQIVQPLRDSGQLGDSYRLSLSGTADKLRDTWRALRFNVLLALLITYLLMAALFESWLYPLVIILSVPLGAVGGILGLRLLNQFVLQPLDVLTMLGFVILIGTVVNNPILIVHQSLTHLREEGMSPRDAILESVRTRIRPIFMTTMTTVLGLLPLVLVPGAGSELYRGLGSVVLGGLLVSTVFTLVLVPTLFSLAMDAKLGLLRLVRRLGARRQPEREKAPRELARTASR